MARIWVEDSGIGIAPDDLPYLFNRFHRGRNAAEYPGSGLDLSIVRAIAERHEGRVWAESEKGRTRFTLVLPRTPAPLL
jgi:signal transduction histidine kinase